MLLKLALLEDINAGKVDVIFRRWNRPTVKTGGSLKTKLGQLSILSVTDMSADDVTEADAKRAGFKDVADFHRWLDTMKEGAIFQRIEVAFEDE